MREIKFRAWDKENKRWLDEIAVFNDGSWCGDIIQPNHTRVSGYSEPDCELMQYTGLKDKNGKEIYEGDIILCSMSFEGGTLPHMGEIVYDETFGSFGTKNEAGVTLLYNHCLHTIEVIGNIYEQSHLLNK